MGAKVTLDGDTVGSVKTVLTLLIDSPGRRVPNEQVTVPVVASHAGVAMTEKPGGNVRVYVTSVASDGPSLMAVTVLSPCPPGAMGGGGS